MFQVEQRFERSMINFEGQEPPIRHYPIAEVVAGHLVFHIIGIQPIKEPGGHIYKRRTHLMVTKTGIAAELLNQNDFEEVMVFVVIPPLNPSSSIPETKRCTAIFECSDKYHPNTKGWGYPESVTIPPAPSTAPINIPRCLPTAPPIDANDAQSQ